MKGKRIFLILAAAIIVAGSFSACSGKANINKNITSDKGTTVSVVSGSEVNEKTTVVSTTKSGDKTTKKNSENTTDDDKNNAKEKATTSKPKSDSKASASEVNTTKKTISTTKKSVTTTKKKVTTTKKKVTTTKKKVTTTKKSTKNVTPSEICSKTNAYIRSKGGNIDTSLRPNSSSWDGQITSRQDFMNDGTVLDSCKWYADLAISEGAVRLYCYYDGDAFYILFMPF